MGTVKSFGHTNCYVIMCVFVCVSISHTRTHLLSYFLVLRIWYKELYRIFLSLIKEGIDLKTLWTVYTEDTCVTISQNMTLPHTLCRNISISGPTLRVDKSKNIHIEELLEVKKSEYFYLEIGTSNKITN